MAKYRDEIIIIIFCAVLFPTTVMPIVKAIPVFLKAYNSSGSLKDAADAGFAAAWIKNKDE